MMMETVTNSENSNLSIGLITAPSLEIAKKLGVKTLGLSLRGVCESDSLD